MPSDGDDDTLMGHDSLDFFEIEDDPKFAELLCAATAACRVPIAMVCVRHRGRRWFQSNVPLPALSATPSGGALWRHTVETAGMTAVADAGCDPRFADDPLVAGPLQVRFYVGAPLWDGAVGLLGSLCVVDRERREPDEVVRATLLHLAHAMGHAILDQRGRQTQRRLALRLQASEAAVRRRFEASPAILQSVSADGVMRAVSNAWLGRFGYRREDVIGRPAVDFLTSQSERHAQTYGRPILFRTGRLDRIEMQFVAKSGEIVDTVMSVVVDDEHDDRALDGHPRERVGVVEEVTAQRCAERALDDERRRLLNLIDAAEVGTWEWNVQTGALRVNHYWAAMVGHTLEELEPVSIQTRLQRIHPDDLDTSLALLESHFAGDTPMYQFDGRMRHRDGRFIWMTSRGKVVTRTADGKAEWMFGTMKDIDQRKRQEEALRRSEGFLLRTGRMAGVGGWENDLITGTISWSAETPHLYGVPADYTPTFETALSFYEPGARAILRKAVARAAAGGEGWDLELPFIRGDGRRIWVRTIGKAVLADGKPVKLVGACQDITEIRRLSNALAEQHELLRVTLESIGDGVITTNALGCVTWLNPVAAALTGWSAADAQGRPVAEVFNIIHAESRAPAENPFAQCLTNGSVVGLAQETVLVSRDGSEYGIEDSAAPIRNRDGDMLGMVLVFHDVTEQRRLAGEMTYRASHDALTGLVNRAEFELRLRRLLHRAQADRTHNAVLYIDLDQFKIVNDTGGHATGDQLLCQVARLLSELVRGSDTLARLGGDEFAIILEHCREENALRLAQRICDQMEVFRFTHDEWRFRIGASIGLVPIDDRWASTSVILQAADSCCHAAKEGGRNRVHVWSDSDQAMHARKGQMQWVTRLEQALDEGRFVLFGQRIEPLGEDDDGLHAEVLLRMREGDGALVPPGAFLPAAERFHLASRIDRWVLRSVIRWMTASPSLDALATLCVNLSGQSVGDRAFHRWAIAELSEAGDRICRRLCVEITETSAVTNLADAAVFIVQLHAVGVRVALDDFGAGASSFGYLKSMTVDFLKIDGQFIRNLMTDTLDAAAVRCFTDVAKVVGMKTVAEFVDSAEVLRKLRLMGVNFAQGFLIHRPEPIEDLMRAGAVGVRERVR